MVRIYQPLHKYIFKFQISFLLVNKLNQKHLKQLITCFLFNLFILILSKPINHVTFLKLLLLM